MASSLSSLNSRQNRFQAAFDFGCREREKQAEWDVQYDRLLHVGGYYLCTHETGAIMDRVRVSSLYWIYDIKVQTWLTKYYSFYDWGPISIIQLGEQAKEMEFGAGVHSIYSIFSGGGY